jgi:transmembrane sensor
MSDEKTPAVGPEGARPSPMTAIAPELPTGTALATPLRHHLMSRLDEAASSRMWKSIEGRLWGEPRARGRLAGLAVALACTMLIATSVGLLGQRLALWGGARRDDASAGGPARLPLQPIPPQPIPPQPVPLQPLPALAPPGSDVPRERLAAQPPQAPGPLVLADGRAFEHLEGEAHAARSLRLSDGSSIEAEAGARVEALSSGASEFSLVVRRGRVRFSVTPGGPRRWSIEARGTRVEVVGTVLTVASNDEGVRVAVEVGAVVVRSASIADGVQRLGAGESLLLPATPKADVSRPLEAGGPSSVPAPPERRKPRSTRRSVPQEPVPQEPVPQQRVPQQPEPRPALPQQLAPAQPAQVRELWTRADTARRGGDVREASQLLARLVREHPRDPRAQLGAFTLGTLLADELDRPADAAIAFRNALELGLPAMLRDACYLSLASALRDADDVAGVRAVVARYAIESPDGDQLSALREIEQQTLTEPGSAP